MRAVITKVLTGSALAAAALAVSACGSQTETTTDNTLITDVDSNMSGDTMTDNMTAVDGASNMGMMANDMGGNDAMMMSNTTTTTNAM
jgi:hypothetical protein